MLQPQCEPVTTLSHVAVGGIQVFIGGLQVQDGSGHLHSNRRHGGLCRSHRTFDGTTQRARQSAAFGVKLHHGFRHSSKLLCGCLQSIGVTSGQCRPGFSGRCNSLACQHQQGRIKASELFGFVIHNTGMFQPERLAHSTQEGGRHALRRFGIRAEKNQVLRQSLQHTRLAFGQCGVLLQNTRGSAFGVDVMGQQPRTHGLKKARSNCPESPGLRLCLSCCQPCANLGHTSGRFGVGCFNNFQGRMVHAGTQLGRIRQCFHPSRHLHRMPAPLHRPQIRRMHPVSTGKLHHRTVLRKQRNRRSLLPLEHAFEVFGQRETGALQARSRIITAQLGPLNKLLRKRFHSPKHFGRRDHPHHFQCAHGLVQLLASDAQVAGVELGQVGAAGQFCVANKAAHGLGCAVKGLSQLIQYPSQGAQIAVGRFDLGACNRIQ